MKAWHLHNVCLALATTLIISFSDPSSADEVRAAVAANFTAAIKQIEPMFEQKTGHTLNTSFGATGQLFAQVQNGAPFEVFLAADDSHFKPLADAGLAVQGSEAIYAVGRVVLWQNAPGSVHEHASASDLSKALQAVGRGKIAIANPKAAPYGLAAEQAMQKLGLYESLKGQLVTGENIAQAQQFVASGAAPLGFIALAQVKSLPADKQGSWWLVPADLHSPIQQQAMLLKKGENNAAAKAFLAFLQSPEAVAIIHKLGYATKP